MVVEIRYALTPLIAAPRRDDIMSPNREGTARSIHSSAEHTVVYLQIAPFLRQILIVSSPELRS